MINLLEDGFVCPSFFRNDDVGEATITPDSSYFFFVSKLSDCGYFLSGKTLPGFPVWLEP